MEIILFLFNAAKEKDHKDTHGLDNVHNSAEPKHNRVRRLKCRPVIPPTNPRKMMNF